MKNRYKIAAFILAIVFLVFLPHTNLLNQFDSAFSQKTVLQDNGTTDSDSNSAKTPTATKSQPDPALKTQLLAAIQNDLKDYQSYSVSIYDLNHNDDFGLNQDTEFPAASVMKMLVGTSYLRGVEQGIYKLDSTSEWELQQMVNQSNNDSWDYFNNMIGFDGEQRSADNLGLPGVVVNQNQMTTRSAETLLLKLYKGQALNTTDRDKLFGYLQNTEDENRISTAIPKGVTFYHKTGYYLGAIHDAALVIHPKNPFILVIFTDDETGNFAENVRFASFKTVTQKVYQYFDSI